MVSRDEVEGFFRRGAREAREISKGFTEGRRQPGAQLQFASDDVTGHESIISKVGGQPVVFPTQVTDPGVGIGEDQSAPWRLLGALAFGAVPPSSIKRRAASRASNALSPSSRR